MIRCKICCISSPDEARRAVAAGASALGLVAAMPSGPGVLDDDTICAIAATVPPGVDAFLLTARTDAPGLIAHQRHARVPTLQLCDRVAPDVRAAVRAALPGIRLVQVVHVVDEASVAEARDAARHADALLLDSGRPDAAAKELGGTGRAHDWALSARIVAEAPVPVWLAGGLRPDNVAEAIARVRPFGLDVCSGVRSGGALDDAKLASFVAAAGAAATRTANAAR